MEWVNLRELPAGPKVDPTKGLPSQHGDHLFDGGYDFIGTGSTPPARGSSTASSRSPWTPSAYLRPTPT